ncbi:M50 family metallopeptidase [Candidatus Palauibacter sp.]|uniref:M50 family metallopeptidase n=1 Tax=Candidatus Palauibacter sp. TaxID=3101350 RepID=UPI003B519FE0
MLPLFGSFRIGRWFGFPIRIDYSWFPVAALVIWTFSTREFPRALPFYPSSAYLAMGTAAALLFFLSVLLHELGHALAGRMRGVTVEHITLFIFGGIAQARDEPRRPLDEFLLTAAGPLTSLALAGLFHAARLAAEAWYASPPVITVLGFLALLNFVLAVFNMIPGFPLDGGRIFRSIVWAVTGDLLRATRWATRGGRLFGAALIALGLFNLSRGQFISGLWAAFIGWFVVNAAASSLRHFELRHLMRQIPVAAVMSPRPCAIEAGLSVERAISDFFLRGRQEAYPVERDGGLIGVVDVRAVSEVPANLRAGTPVSAVTRPAEEFPVAQPDESLVDALFRARAGASSLLVIRDGFVVGALDPREVVTRVRRMQRLGLVSPDQVAAPEGPDGEGVRTPPAKSA